MLKLAIPLLHVSASVKAEEFYCNRLGFSLTFAHRHEGGEKDPCYMSVSRDGVVLHLSSLSGDGVVGGVVNIVVDDVDRLHEELLGRGTPIDLEPIDQTWGAREMHVKDPDGNSIRFQAWPRRRP